MFKKIKKWREDAPKRKKFMAEWAEHERAWKERVRKEKADKKASDELEISKLKLVPCNWCGTDDLTLDHNLSSWYVWCAKCDTRSAYVFGDKLLCMKEWNRVMSK